MVELISKVSKGSRMDQIYIPKWRMNFPVGSYVIIKQIEAESGEIRPFFYNITYLEPIKAGIINDIFSEIGKVISADNVIITGSFLDNGFRFNDIDVIVVSEDKGDIKKIENLLQEKTGVLLHIILISNKELIKGLSTDPLYLSMLSRCVSKKRLIYNIRKEVNYKLLDLHLLKCELLLFNFDSLTGDEKYKMVRNLISINQFIGLKKISRDSVDSMIEQLFGRAAIRKLKDNILEKEPFLARYKKEYTSIKEKVLEGIGNGSKQK